MDYGSLISGSFEYTKDALWGRWGRWLILVVLSLVQTFTLFLVPLYNGYIVRVLAGRTPPLTLMIGADSLSAGGSGTAAQ